ncbi:HET-domain-containing protein [Hypoxylon rubiginosum]|uniref:HET-domain-containing protein n=1 Tax=Hypoxylon rubiginosum TaxID=110542 RepID=A0ACB9YVE4_9PEZI|nr:HET-domain-containing protein [Hypoxylon rubiginosum]
MVPSNLSHICSRCQVLHFDDAAFGTSTRDESGRHHFQIDGLDNTRPILAYELRDDMPELPLLTKSIRKNDCEFCRILKTSTLKSCSHWSRGVIQVRLQLVFSPEGRLMSVLARVARPPEGGDENGEILLLFGVDGRPNEPCSQWLRLQPSPESTIFSNSSIWKIRSMLQDMELPEASSSGTFYPTRLIQTGIPEEDTCRLVVTDSDLFPWHQRPKYAALSYCWGPPEDAKLQFKTEQATYRDRISGFLLGTTSRIMQDAVEVCRSLGIPYLWVDAVCIIQDDKADWERESADMTNVYKNAHLTICTPTSTSCREGFLGERASATISFHSRINPDVVGSYVIRPCGVISDPRTAEGDYERIDNSDTSPYSNWWKRGWTFQELALSTRVLLFGTKLHLIFEDKFWSEGDEEMTESTGDEPPGFGGMGGMFAVISVADTLDAEDNEHMWMSMVEQYTARQLTYESDKLPAMSGLAKIAVLGRGDMYLAGIRKEFLHRDLFWTPAMDTDAQGERESKVSFDSLLASLNASNLYIAPSWSWARWQGKIRFDESPAPFGDHVPVMQYEGCVEKAYESAEVWTAASELNPFGQVTGGSLKLTGKVASILPQLQLQEGLENHWEMCDEAGEYVADLTFDWDEPEGWVPFEQLSLVLVGSYWSWQAYKTAKMYDGVATDDAHSDEYMEDDVDIDDDGDVNMILHEEDESMDGISSEDGEISFEEALTRDKDVDRFAYGLIIYPAEVEGKYFRVGVFSSWPKGKGGLKGHFEGLGTRTVEIV